LALPPLFVAWHDAFNVSYAGLGLSVALMSGTTAVLQTPVGFLVDRYGAKPLLIGGALLMSLAMAAMATATSFWQILLLTTLAGVGNSVFHPADYAILSSSIARERIGRSFAIHHFSGHLGFAVAPPVVAVLALAMGWRSAVLLIGLLGVPVVAAIALQSRILTDQTGAQPHGAGEGTVRRPALFTRRMVLFFGFFMFGSMAQSGIQSWLITVLQTANAMSLEAASSALTGYVAGSTAGVLFGGWLSDRLNNRHLLFTSVLIIVSATLMLTIGLISMPDMTVLALITVAGIAFGASRVSRDIMVKDAAPPGQIGKVFGFVSAGLPLGQALTPVPFGFLIDWGHADLVLIVAAGILLLSLLCGSGASIRDASRVSRASKLPAQD